MESRQNLRSIPYLSGGRVHQFRELRTDPLAYMSRARDEARARGLPLIRFKTDPYRMVLLCDPEAIEWVLHRNAKNYDKNTTGNVKIKQALGEGLLTSQGESWRVQRRMSQPVFHQKNVDQLSKMMKDTSEFAEKRWTDLIQAGMPNIDMKMEMTRLTLRVVGKALATVDFTSDAENIGEDVNEVLADIEKRMLRLFNLPRWVPTRANRRFAQVVDRIDRRMLSLIHDKRAASTAEPDLLHLLMAARNDETREGPEKMSDPLLQGQLKNFLGAGHETTGSTLCWIWHLLARHPEAAKRLRKELNEILGDRSITIEDTKRLPYTRQIIQEALRLYPPVWAIGRRALNDDQLMGFRLTRGTRAVACMWAMHRHPDHWSRPEQFVPERFASGEPTPSPYVYFPFGVGPRHCIGRGFAMTELTILVATLCRRFSASHINSDQSIDLEPSITLRPRGEMRMKLELLS